MKKVCLRCSDIAALLWLEGFVCSAGRLWGNADL
jgi:hypothetical protein